MRDNQIENQMGLSRRGTIDLKIIWGSPDTGQARQKRKDALPMRDRLSEIRNIVSTNKNRRIMTKFNEKSLHSFALAFFYAAMQAFDSRMAEVESALTSS